MDTRERWLDTEETLRTALDELQTRIWTAMPGIIQSYNPTPGPSTPAGSVVVQLGLQGVQALPGGGSQYKSYSQLVDVPVVFPRGGGCTFTFPISAGDGALVVFASRCIDSWLQAGGVNNVPMDASRLHDLSDGFAFVGPFSSTTSLASISTTEAQLRSNDGSTVIALDPLGQIVSVVAPGGFHITAPTVITGTLTVSESIAAQTTITADGLISSSNDVQAGTISLGMHKHGGVQIGSSQTGVPT